MNENNFNMMDEQYSSVSNDSGDMNAKNFVGSKKNGFIMLGVAIVLAMISDLIPLPVDDIISIILAVLGGKNIFNN